MENTISIQEIKEGAFNLYWSEISTPKVTKQMKIVCIVGIICGAFIPFIFNFSEKNAAVRFKVVTILMSGLLFLGVCLSIFSAFLSLKSKICKNKFIKTSQPEWVGKFSIKLEKDLTLYEEDIDQLKATAQSNYEKEIRAIEEKRSILHQNYLKAKELAQR